MSEDLESRTEEATPRQRERYREDGRVAFSREIVGLGVLVAVGAALALLAPAGAQRIAQATRSVLSKLDEMSLADSARWLSTALSPLLLLVPLGLVAVGAAVASGLAQTRGLFSMKSLEINLQRLNPLPRLQQLLASKQALVSIGQATLKLAVVIAASAALFLDEFRALSQLGSFGSQTLLDLGGATLRLALRVAALLGLFAAIDWWLNRRRIEQQMKMTPDEVRREHREQDGDPKVKGRLRAKQRELGKNRMMSQVPHSDVVLVNPTHYAVALRYDATSMRAPRVLAKGQDAVALRIRDLARSHRVPILHNPPLARALHSQVQIGGEVPAHFYGAIAEVLAWVYRLRGRA